MSRFDEFVNKQNRIFAKTYARTHPHEYCLKIETNTELFERAVIYIREKGYKEMFYSKEFTCFNYGPYKYRSMGAPLEETILINRTILSPSSEHNYNQQIEKIKDYKKREE